MQGLEAISANNGWAMALAGACIVMTGLATLSFIISQLHRFIALFEKADVPEKIISKVEPAPAPVEEQAAEVSLLDDLEATAREYQPLTEELGETFDLIQLHRLMEAENLPHPHITLRELRSAGYLAAMEEGTFCWKNI